MLSRYRTSLLTTEQTIARPRRSFAIPVTSRAVTIGAVAVILITSAASEMLGPALTLRAVTIPSGVNVSPAAKPIQITFANDISREFFFGFLEFDWKPNAVPGFGPLPNSTAQIAIAEATD
jgi:hypothetical protein